jgi:hypothetical protein
MPLVLTRVLAGNNVLNAVLINSDAYAALWSALTEIKRYNSNPGELGPIRNVFCAGFGFKGSN